MTNEPPQSIRSNLLRSYSSYPISDKNFWEGCNKPRIWHKMVYGLCFFHALVQERIKYGALGWNIPYHFNETDLRISVQQLQMFLNDNEDLPIDALRYLTGECNYGGRVTDANDRRCLLSLLSMFYNHKFVSQDDCSISPSGAFIIPPEGSYESYLEFLKALPSLAGPEVCGLHENADISKDKQETSQLFDAILLTLPRENEAVNESVKSTGSDLVMDILSKLPEEDFDVHSVIQKYPIEYMESMHTVLRQEVIRFNTLTAIIRSSLQNLLKAIEGVAVMSTDLEELYGSMLVGKIPTLWAARSYPSLKPLGSYVLDLLDRLRFFHEWIAFGSPKIFWISGFYFTQSFLTGVLQNFARKYTIPIDTVGFDFKVLKEYILKVLEQNSTEEVSGLQRPDNGALITGLFMDGARWDSETEVVTESKPKILYDAMPVIWLLPKKLEEIDQESKYACPVYKTSIRRGTLSTTGHSTNYVLSILLPTQESVSHWINRGVAALCQLDD